MSAATSLAAAHSRSRRWTSVVLLLCGFAVMSVPVGGNEQVYIWRDQTGAVRFSPVPEPARGVPEAAAPAAPRRGEPPSESVVDGARASGSY